MRRSMKYRLVILTTIAVSAGLILLGCGGASTQKSVQPVILDEGWIDDDTFRVSARGTPVSLERDVEERKKSAERAAVLNARYMILEKFKKYKMKSASGIEEFEMTGTAIAQELKARIQEGRVKSATWDEKQNCELVYEVYAPGLKRKVMAAEWKDE